MKELFFALAAVLASPVLADAPLTSIAPQMRPTTAPIAAVRPVARPGSADVAQVAEGLADVEPQSIADMTALVEAALDAAAASPSEGLMRPVARAGASPATDSLPDFSAATAAAIDRAEASELLESGHDPTVLVVPDADTGARSELTRFDRGVGIEWTGSSGEWIGFRTWSSATDFNPDPIVFEHSIPLDRPNRIRWEDGGLPLSAPPLRPVARDPQVAFENFLDQHAVLLNATARAPRTTISPPVRPDAIEVMARRVQREQQAGAVCGDVSIQGERVADIAGRISGCGVDNPVRIRSVAGVTLSTPATMDCTTAQALRSWVENGARPATGNIGGGIAGLRVVAHYACRTRNNQAGARISEHGKGRAIDIAGITLRDGSELSVLRDWNNGNRGAALRQMHAAACGPFGTVLGPNANRFHLDHFHFDTARYRSGSYCR